MLFPNHNQIVTRCLDEDQRLDQWFLNIDKATIRTFLNQMHRVEIADRGIVQSHLEGIDPVVEDTQGVPCGDRAFHEGILVKRGQF